MSATNPRVLRYARLHGVKLPPLKGRMRARRRGEDLNVWMKRIVEPHHARNAYRQAMEALVDIAGQYRGRLTRQQRHAAGRAVARVMGVVAGKAVSS